MKYMVRNLVAGAHIIGTLAFTQAPLAQNGAGQVVGMTGDKDAVWIATSDNQLIYCWWPQDPKRLDQQANCRVLNRFRVDRLQ